MRTLIITLKGDTQWDSCRDINRGLDSFYRALYRDCHKIEIAQGEKGARQVERAFIDLCPEHIVITDHRIRFPQALYYLKEKNFKLSAHIFGCFLDRISEDWRFMDRYFSGKSVRFMAASTTYKKLCEKIFNIDRALVLPFPVMDRPAPTSASKRDIRTLVYAGRVSAGKNALALCRLMPKLRARLGAPIKLIIIGAIDDMGWQFQEKKNILGAMAYQFANVMDEVNHTEELIEYIPHTEDKEFLYSFYEKADCIVSLSTMKNEDYGMALADGIAMNKNIVCSNWGGHRDFIKYSDNVFPVKVGRVGDQYIMDEREVLDALLAALSTAPTAAVNPLAPKSLVEKNSLQMNEWPQFSGLSKDAKFIERTKTKIATEDPYVQKLYEVFHD